MRLSMRKLTYTAILVALAMIIPLQFGFLKIVIPPFTATLASHVPMFLAMFFGPWVAVVVGIGSAVGFFLTSPLVVAARALMHSIVGLSGAVLLARKVSFPKVVLLTAPLHGVLEALAVIPFGFTLDKILIVVGVGTILHHLADGAITMGLARALSRSGILKD
ncbi:MAG: ECF transporter S component [Bacillota bacterium]